jgi:ornithine cyclodeaminase/alanine dehydrogenase-like protein (mu-crystallin family)
LEGLLIVRPDKSKINVFDIDVKNAENFAQRVKSQYKVEIEIADSVENAVSHFYNTSILYYT